MSAWMTAAAWGLGCGILSSWGVGGGTLLLIVMTLFLGVEPETARGINLLFFLPTAAAGLLCHRRRNCLDAPALKASVPPALAGAVLGALLTGHIDAGALRRPFGVYLLLSGAGLLLAGKRENREIRKKGLAKSEKV